MCLVCCYWLAIISFYLWMIMLYWCCEGRLYLLNVAKDYFYLQNTHYECDDTKAIKYRSPHMRDIRPAYYGVLEKQCVTWMKSFLYSHITQMIIQSHKLSDDGKLTSFVLMELISSASSRHCCSNSFLDGLHTFPSIAAMHFGFVLLLFVSVIIFYRSCRKEVDMRMYWNTRSWSHPIHPIMYLSLVFPPTCASHT